MKYRPVSQHAAVPNNNSESRYHLCTAHKPTHPATEPTTHPTAQPPNHPPTVSDALGCDQHSLGVHRSEDVIESLALLTEQVGFGHLHTVRQCAIRLRKRKVGALGVLELLCVGVWCVDDDRMCEGKGE
jgi:hypothetical protein